ncbi:MAG: flagellar protein [Lachnospiraceae bacterium]|nr:flagellar protein [Lachnospiraceae bacterium]
MNVRNCRNCGRIFNYLAGPHICQRCREELEAKFQEVKEYIRKNPGVSIPEVSDACDVEPSQIRQWLREERLELTENSPIYLTCEGCGASIRCGRFCETCKNNTAAGLKNVLRENAPEPPKPVKKDKENPRMRFLT